MVPLMSIWRNFFLGAEPVRGLGPVRWFDSATAKRIVREQLELEPPDLELADIESLGNGAWHLIFHYRGDLADRAELRRGENVALAEWFPLDSLPDASEVAHHGWALDVLARLPVQVSYNLTIADRRGDAVTSCVAPDRRPLRRDGTAATNHPPEVEWPEHARATRSVEREARLLELLEADDDADPAAAFLEPPLFTTAYADGFGTLYTAAYRPRDAAVEYRWRGARWRQSLDAFEEGTRTIRLPASEDGGRSDARADHRALRWAR
jgi:hypothetical protein